MFFEIEFPKTIAPKAMGGPAFNTTVNTGFSGFEQRNQNWAAARGKWTIAVDTPSPKWVQTQQEFVDQLTAFFLIAAGKANSFRLKDHKDYTSGTSAQVIGTGTGVASLYQLTKTYNVGSASYVRAIYKPITSLVVDYLNNALSDSVAITVGGIVQPKNAGYVGGGSAQYTLDQTQGIVNFGAASVLGLSAVSVSGTIATFTYTITSGLAPALNQQVNVTSMTHSGNDGAFIITSVTPTSSSTGTFTVVNASAVVESGSTGTGRIRASHIAISAASYSSGTTTYTYTLTNGQALALGMRVTITGMAHAGNNGIFYITGLGAGTFSVANASGATATEAGDGLTDWVPAVNAVIQATFSFHFPVRFDVDDLAIQLEESNVAGGQPVISWNSIPLIEVRILNGQG